MEEERGDKGTERGDKEAEGNHPQELWWRITIRPHSGYFGGFIGWGLRKLGFFKQKEYDPNDALDIQTTYDENGTPTTTIKPKE